MSSPDGNLISLPAPDVTPDGAPSPSSRKRRPTVAELRDRPLPTDRLWTIEDVAAFLQCSVREAEDVVKDPGVPQPRLSRGRLRRWSPKHWHAWMEAEDETYVPNSDDDEPELGTV
jgi:hypothetical protein